MSNPNAHRVLIDSFVSFALALEGYADADNVPAGFITGRAFGLLEQVRPDLAGLIDGSDFDPRGDARRFPLFYGYLARHWDDDLSAI